MLNRSEKLSGAVFAVEAGKGKYFTIMTALMDVGGFFSRSTIHCAVVVQCDIRHTPRVSISLLHSDTTMISIRLGQKEMKNSRVIINHNDKKNRQLQNEIKVFFFLLGNICWTVTVTVTQALFYPSLPIFSDVTTQPDLATDYFLHNIFL